MMEPGCASMVEYSAPVIGSRRRDVGGPEQSMRIVIFPVARRAAVVVALQSIMAFNVPRAAEPPRWPFHKSPVSWLRWMVQGM